MLRRRSTVSSGAFVVEALVYTPGVVDEPVSA
jgi:hypothetical protein